MRINDKSMNYCANFGHNWIKNSEGDIVCQYCGRTKDLKNE